MRKQIIFTILLSLFLIQTQAQTKKVPAKKPVVTNKAKVNPKPKHIVTKINPTKSAERLVEIKTDYGVMVAKLYNETPLHRDNFVKLVKQGFYDSLLFHRIIKSFMIQGGDPTSKTADSTAMLGSGDVGYRIPAEFLPSLYHKRGALSAARDNNPERASSGCQFYIVQGKTFTLEELEKIINSRNLSRKQLMMYTLYQKDTVQARLSALQTEGNKEAQQNYMLSLQTEVEKEYSKLEPNKIDYDQIDYYMKIGGTPHLDGDYTVFGEVISGLEVLDKIAEVQTRPGDRPVKDVRMKIRLLN
jgi:cyclophilin family peptidyl-prolyl cis-trans isomerase